MPHLRRSLSHFVLFTAFVLCAETVTASVGPQGRVAGLAVSIIDQVANGAGKDVDIRVDMTTVRTSFIEYNSIERGVNNATFAFTLDEISARRYGFGGLGDANLRATISASDTQGRDFSGFFYATTPFPRLFGASYYGVALEFTFQGSEFVEGELPALDYGDGITVDVETLSPFGTPVTSTTNDRRVVRSRWRGTFTHTYDDQGSYVVTAASRCCPGRGSMGDDDTVERGGGVNPGYVVPPISPQYLQYSFSSYRRLQFQSAYPSPFTVSPTTFRQQISPRTGTFTDTFSEYGTGVRGGGSQVTNTALVEAGIGSGFAIEIPTAGAYGLGLLSLLLAAGGVLALRR